MTNNDAFLSDLSQAIESVCKTHGLHFYGLNGYTDVDETTRLRLTISDRPRTLSKEDASYLDAWGISGYHLTQNLRNPNDGKFYIVSGLNRDNSEKCIVIRSLDTGIEYLVDIEHLKIMTPSSRKSEE